MYVGVTKYILPQIILECVCECSLLNLGHLLFYNLLKLGHFWFYFALQHLWFPHSFAKSLTNTDQNLYSNEIKYLSCNMSNLKFITVSTYCNRLNIICPKKLNPQNKLQCTEIFPSDLFSKFRKTLYCYIITQENTSNKIRWPNDSLL